LAGDVPGHRHAFGVMVTQQLDQHPGEAVDGVRHLTGGGGQVLGQGVESAIGDGVAVEECEGGHLDRGESGEAEVHLCSSLARSFERVSCNLTRRAWMLARERSNRATSLAVSPASSRSM